MPLKAWELAPGAGPDFFGGIFSGGEGAGPRMFAPDILATDLARSRPGVAPVQRQHFAAKKKIAAVHFGKTRDGRAAGAVESSEEAALAGNGEMGLRIVDCFDKAMGGVIIAADLDADSALAEGGQPLG